MSSEYNHAVQSEMNVLVINVSTMTCMVSQAITMGVILGISEILSEFGQPNKGFHP